MGIFDNLFKVYSYNWDYYVNIFKALDHYFQKCRIHLLFFFSVCLFLTYLLEYNCFRLMCQFLLYNKVDQLYIHIYPHISSLSHLPPTLPIQPLQVDTKHQADLPVLCGCFPLAIYFTFGSVYMSMSISHFISAYPSPSPCPQVHSLRLCLYSCPAPRFIRTIFYYFRFQTHVLAYGICFSLL